MRVPAPFPAPWNSRKRLVVAHTGIMRLDPDDELTELLDLDQAAALAQVTRRTLNRWIQAKRLRLLPGGYVIEGELLDAEALAYGTRNRGRPGARQKLSA